MACEDLKAALVAIQNQVAELEQTIADNPPPERAAAQKAAQPQLNKLGAESQAAAAALSKCLQAVAPPSVPLLAPQNILEIVNVMSADWLAGTATALQALLNSLLPGTVASTGVLGDNTFPLFQPSEWIQPLAPSTEYDDDVVAATGWAVNPRVVSGDFPFSHPFHNSINDTPWDFEFSLAMDRPVGNPSQFDFLLTAGNKAPSGATDERAMDENYANDWGLVFPLGLLGVEMDSANIPRGFINGVQPGNRMAVFGRWIVDTGHTLSTVSGAKVCRAEIHPPLLMATASMTDLNTTRVLFTSRPFLVGDTYTPDLNTIYDDSVAGDGSFRKHIAIEVGKVNTTIPILGIPVSSIFVEAHPKIKSLPFRGPHLMHLLVRPPARPAVTELEHLEVSYCFTVRSGCSVEVTQSAPDTIDVYVVMNSAGYKTYPLPANNVRTWSTGELAVLNSSAGTGYDVGYILSTAVQLETGGLIAAGVVDYILSRGIKSDAYASLNDVVDISSTQGSVTIAAGSGFPLNVGITHNDNQPFPVYGWLEAKWVSGLVIGPVGPIATLIDLNGTWASGGVPGAVISVSGNAISVDMSAYKRPTAVGSILDNSDITVIFPDDNTYTGKLQPPGTIAWSNNSFWTKALSGSITTLIDLNGAWASGGVPGPVISVSGNAISVDMSAYKRPTAFGSILDNSDITVTFPDDNTYTGKLQPPGTIAWSNNSFWTKVVPGSVPTLIDLNGAWASGGVPGPVISVSGNSISVDMSAYKRPTAHGSVIDSSHITVTFPDDKTYTGILQLPSTIVWSNNSAWTKMPAGAR